MTGYQIFYVACAIIITAIGVTAAVLNEYIAAFGALAAAVLMLWEVWKISQKETDK